MVYTKPLAAIAAVSLLAPRAAAFDAQSEANVAVYYGQGYNQTRLSHFCQETSLDIINIGFVNVFPDVGEGQWPGSNFGNQCNGQTYVNADGEATQLLSGCSQIADDIPICQQAGKKVFISLGGASPANGQVINNDDSARDFADFLWGAFGPKTDAWTAQDGPRPFGDAVVDGFDFDIEHNGPIGYAALAQRLRDNFSDFPSKQFYLSAAPQCVTPDAQLSPAIALASFDFIWVQFYNTDPCSARAWVDGDGVSAFTFDAWIAAIKLGGNPSAKLLIGLPADPTSAYYLSPEEVEPLVEEYMGKYPDNFGGIMVWEATASDENQIEDRSYAANMKSVLLEYAPPVATPTPSPSSSVIPSSTPTPSSKPTPSGQSASAVSSSTPTPSSKPTPSGQSTSVISSGKPMPSGQSTSSASPSGKPTPSGQSSAAVSSSKPTPSGQSTSAISSGKPTPSGKPSPSGKPTPSGQPTSSSKVTPSGQPAPSGKATPSGQPASSGKPTPSGQSTSAVSSGKPSPSGKPAPSGQSPSSASPSGKPTPSGQSTSAVSSGKPTPSGQPASGKPTPSGQPTSSGKATPSGQSASSGKPTPSGQSSSSSNIVSSGKPTTGKATPSGNPTSTPGAISVSKAGSSAPATFSGAPSSVAISTARNSGSGSSSVGAIPSSSGAIHPTTTGQVDPSITAGVSISSAASQYTSSSSELATVTTVIVTSYVDICPTGLTTITTTYTTYYCPGTVSATTTPAALPTGSPSQTTPQLPEGWTTTVTVCTQCAATPTTVTLTKPVAATSTNVVTATATGTASAGSSGNSGSTGNSGSSGNSGSTAVSGQGATVTASLVLASPSGVAIVPGQSGAPSEAAASSTGPALTTVPVIPVKLGSNPMQTGTGSHQTTFSFKPSTPVSRVPVSPSGTQGSVAPVFTGAAGRASATSWLVAVVAVAVSALSLM
ncbi:class III chitinase ChiA1 [Paecilomyces variotii No. 5]|uniref:chitinase n=1 Tax=Byssochlamys spectabilis (strain No. 5 / NBRC 109023) TaxID=1356009 RepID=V5FZ12_BYSSN|nr:class III chitinase ChiA1 [Paecilomyces variotii No. 5]